MKHHPHFKTKSDVYWAGSGGRNCPREALTDRLDRIDWEIYQPWRDIKSYPEAKQSRAMAAAVTQQWKKGKILGKCEGCVKGQLPPHSNVARCQC